MVHVKRERERNKPKNFTFSLLVNVRRYPLYVSVVYPFFRSNQNHKNIKVKAERNFSVRFHFQQGFGGLLIS